MSRILKSIAPYWKSIIIILLLLVLQANCDLALPQYTSNIIDVGIQNGGIGHSIPEKITKDEYDIAKMFMTDEEISIWEKCFEEQDDLYVRTENNDKRLDEYDDTLAMALIINNQMSSVTVTQFKQQMAAQMRTFQLQTLEREWVWNLKHLLRILKMLMVMKFQQNV